MRFINNNKKNIVIFIVIFIITIVIYQGFISRHYATDTYNVVNKGYGLYAINNSFIDGRIFMGTLDIVAHFMNIDIDILVPVVTLIALIISCIAVIILKNMMTSMKKTDNIFLEIIATIIAYITIFNFMYVENMYFIESIVMSISILMYTLAVKEIVQKGKWYYIKAMLLAIIATFAYQGTIGLFLIYGFVFSVIKNKSNKKDIIKDLVTIISIMLIAFIANIVQIHITTMLFNTKQARLEGISNILKNTIDILKHFPMKVLYEVILNCCGLFPEAMLIIFIIFITIMSLIYEIKNKNENMVMGIIEILILTLLVSIAMCIISLGTYNTGRIHNEIGALIGVIFIYIYCNSDIFFKSGNIKAILIVTLLIYTIITMCNTSNLIIQHKIVNNTEKEICENIEKYIESYEEENNTTVTEAKYFKVVSKDTDQFFKNVPNQSVLTYNGIACSWSSIGTINFYTKRNFKDERLTIVENKEIFYKYIELKSEGYDNNFVIIDNVLYYSIFV